MRTVLFVEGCRDGTVGGSHTCLYRTILSLDRQRFRPIVVLYENNVIADSLREAGVEVHVLPNEPPADFVALIRRRWPRLGAIAPLVRPAQQAFNLGRHFARPVASCVAMLRRLQVEIVHLNNSINTNHEWIVAAKLVGRPVISHERGISHRLSGTAVRLGRNVDRVICMSEVIKEPLLRQGLDRRKVVVVYDGIDLSKVRIRERPEVVRDRHGIPRGCPVVGVIGNIKGWKGQETVVRAAALLKERWPELRTLLVGTVVDADYKARLDQIIRESDLVDQVIFAGFQAHPYDYLNLMDIVVHSSVKAEPFGMVNLEAMSMRKAVISTTIGGPAEVFTSGVDGLLIDPGNPVALAHHLDDLLRDEDRRDRMANAGHRTVTDRFRIEDTLRQIEDIYDSLLVGKH